MEQVAASGKDALSQQGFNKLLDWFDPDHNKAALKYEEIRLRLIRFFEFNDCPYSEDCADDVIQRVTRKLNEGVEVKAHDPFTYFRAVARNTLLEYWKNRHRRDIALDDISPTAQPYINPAEIDLEQIGRAHV